ncbi:thiamine pyrophosphokinase [Colletotrichum cuscutae]|uniref:Thiamine pyrophosphokinase n=1 Tax=Colletotrichum cuscutae TaxID=1209917 RepID=A0AAI9YC31_9PEZI|nr:thiamine pyrophosphokinase [Colletotrichum cuscutae]
MSQLWRFLLPGDDRTFGLLNAATVSHMPWTSDFKLDDESRSIRLVPQDGSPFAESCAAAMTRLLKAAQNTAAFPKLDNWPGEKFPVLASPFPFAVDRVIAPYFGIVSTGVQLTIFVRNENGSIGGIWIARRGATKPMYAGMLDNAAGGAVNHHELPFKGLLREAAEELDIDAHKATSGGTISWLNIKDKRSGINEGLVEPGVQFVYDLEVSADTKLHPAEAGIDWLRLLSVEEVKSALVRREFKPSCACVMVDFFVRHGIINVENDRQFAELVPRLHRRLLLPVTYPDIGQRQSL